MAGEQGGPHAGPAPLVLLLSALSPGVSLGEPVFLGLTLRNGREEPVAFDLGKNRKSNLRLTIEDPGGRVAEPPALSDEGMGMDGLTVLPPGGEHLQRVLLNEWMQPPAVGDYRVSAALAGPARTRKGRTVETRPSEPALVRVLPRDAERLERVCRELAERVLGPSSALEAWEAALALGHVADPVAVPYLAEVLRRGGRGAHEAADGLGRLGTAEAFEALLAAAEHPEVGVRARVRWILHQALPGVGDVRLRRRIEEVLKR